MGLRKAALASVDEPVKNERRDSERDLNSLISDLNNSCADVRRWAARDLTNNLAARQAILDQIDKEANPYVIEALFSAIQGMCDEGIAQSLINKLRSEDAQVRNGAIEIFQSQPDLFAAHVKELLMDDDPDTRIFAADIIGVIRHPDARLWLHDLAMYDDNINVVGTAIDKLAEVGDTSTLPVLDSVSKRFGDASYITFAINCVRQNIGDADE